MLLADMGAAVVKVEPPDGEPHRWLSAAPDAPMGAPWALVNRDKVSVVLDLKDEAVRQGALRSLLEVADIVVHNFRPGVDRRLGIDAASVRAVNPAVIHCTISGFGADEAERPGVDIVAEAFSGVASVTGEDATGPTKIGVPLFDVGAGLFATIEILARWIEHSKGDGTVSSPVDCSLVDAAVNYGTFNLAGAATGKQPSYRGKDHDLVAPYGYFPCRRGWIALGCSTEGHWLALCRALDRIDLHADPRFAGNAARVANRSPLRFAMERTLAQGDASTWDEKLAAAGVPCSAVQDYTQVINSDLLLRRRVLEPTEDETLGSFVRLLPLSHSRQGPHQAARHLGADTEAVITALGVAAAAER
jgi:crotonobetainyl-CoA:carnitine CoA-transferase CaiB-like acyl-CoA transferase